MGKRKREKGRQGTTKIWKEGENIFFKPLLFLTLTFFTCCLIEVIDCKNYQCVGPTVLVMIQNLSCVNSFTIVCVNLWLLYDITQVIATVACFRIKCNVQFLQSTAPMLITWPTRCTGCCSSPTSPSCPGAQVEVKVKVACWRPVTGDLHVMPTTIPSLTSAAGIIAQWRTSLIYVNYSAQW